MNSEILKAAIFIIGGFAVFAAAAFWNNYKRKQQRMAKIRACYGKIPEREYSLEEFQAIGRYYRLKKAEGFCIDDITWNDLDMDRIFQDINHTWSCVGESVLYDILRRPQMDEAELNRRERLIRYMASHEKEREEMQYEFSLNGRTGKYSVFDYIYNLTEFAPGNQAGHFLCIGLVILAVCLIFWNVGTGVVALIAAAAFSWSRYFAENRRIEPYIASCRCLMRLLETAKVLKKWEAQPELAGEIQKIEESAAKFKKFASDGKFVVMSGQAGGGIEKVLLDYLNCTFHLNLLSFYRLVREVQNLNDEIYTLADGIGMLEAAAAIASWRETLADCCIPEFTDNGQVEFSIVEGCHPLLMHPVANSICAKRSVLLTGSNASGKSTFLKMAAVNAILAQTVHTCAAESYRASFFRVYSSMALRDDITNSESYFIAEIRSLKRILDAVGSEGAPVLCFVDEVLRGTNTIERIAASAEVLKSLKGKEVLCFAATHDIELTYILEEDFDNYHFQEEISEDDIRFDYRLCEGRAESRNAIRLLKIMGYNPEVIERADQRAKELMEGRMLSCW
ncbi:MAG: hypothetical protein ACI4CZ_00855 [Hominisplanchenecus sp.]